MPNDSDQSQSAPKPMSFEEQTRQRLWKIVIAGIVLIVLIVAARPSYRQFKSWRSRSLAAQAEAALARNDLTNAVQKAQMAYVMRPTEPAALRTAARVQTRTGQPSALEFWQALIRSGDATTEDRRGYVDLAISFGALARARTELQNLIHAGPNDAPNLFLMAKLALAEGKAEEAVEFAKQAAERDKTNLEYPLFLAIADFRNEPASRAKLQELMRDQTRIGLEAATFLAQQPAGSPAELATVIAALEKHPLANTAHELLALSLKLQTLPQARSNLVAAAGAKYSAAGDEHLETFASWANDHGEFAATLRWVPLDRAANDPVLLLHHLDALGVLERWDDIQTILGKPNLPLPEAYREAFRARSATKAGNSEGAAVAWKNALQAASGAPEELFFLAQYAGKSGEFQQAKRAFRALTSGERTSLPVYLAWSQLVQNHGTTEELREVINEMAAKWPEEISLRNDSAYLDLLLHRNTKEAFQTAAQLVQADPANLPFRSTMALAHLQMNQPVQALAVLTERKWDWEQALPTSRMVYALALAASGKTNEASTIAQRIPKGALRPEEQRMIRSALAMPREGTNEAE